MTAKRKVTSFSKKRTFSLTKNVLTVIFSAMIALIFVHKEVQLDKTARNIKTLQMKTAQLQMEIAEAELEVDKLTSFPKISNRAASLNFEPLTVRPTIINISISDLPREFSRKFEILSPDTGGAE